MDFDFSWLRFVKFFFFEKNVHLKTVYYCGPKILHTKYAHYGDKAKFKEMSTGCAGCLLGAVDADRTQGC